VRIASGLVVAANQTGDDITALRQKDGVLLREWIGHPGGEVISLGTADDVVIATTSHRRVVAYSSAGQRLWTMATPELVLAQPTDAGDGKVVFVGLDGTVSSVGARSGVLAWSRKLDADVSTPATIAGAAVVVVDRAGRITAFDRGSGSTLWSRDDEPVSAAVAVESLVVLVGEDGFARAFDALTGDRRWEVRYTGSSRAAVAVGELVVLVSDEQTLGVGSRTGAVSWQWEAADDAISDGRSLILLRHDDASLVDESGIVQRTWTIPSLSIAVYRYGVVGSDGFWLFRSNQPVTRIGEPDD
jgi:outer membrane protein assembly factor BamB